MINPAERRFIRSWEEQREGGIWSYCLMYTFAGGFIISIFSYILIIWIFQVRVPRPYWLIPAVGLTLACIISLVVFRINERRFKGIIKREISRDRTN